jgi:hypothetical protein
VELFYSVLYLTGKDSDLRKLVKCGDLIKTYSENLCELTKQDCCKIADQGNRSDSQDLLSETAVQLNVATEDVKQSVVTLSESVQKVLERERATSVLTPRNKRLLPSPLKALTKLKPEDS